MSDNQIAVAVRRGLCRRAFVASIAALCAFAAVGAGADDGLSVARQALRDGLWELDRAHARTNASEAAKLIVLESYADEGRWDEVKKALSSWGDGLKSPGFGYYRAMVAGEWDKAAQLLKASGSAAGVDEALMLEADALSRKGDRAKAERLWRAVVSSTNAGARALTVAAANLGDAAALRRALDTAPNSSLRALASVRLGMALAKDPATAEEGERIVRAVAKESPDAPDAEEAFLGLARAKAAAGQWKEAAEIWADAIEIWPAAALRADVQQGRGEAFLRLGRGEDALAAFARAEELSKNDPSARAVAVLRQGDVLADLGRGAEAMARYRTVLSEYPKTEIAAKLKRAVEVMELESRGRDYFRDYRFAEAQKAFAAVAAADPRRKDRMDYFEVLCLYGLGDDDAARAKAKDLADGCPDAAVKEDATLWLAKFTYNRGEWKDAANLFLSCAAMSSRPAAAAEALVWAARSLFADGDYKGAIDASTRMVAKYPDSPSRTDALLVQGEALIEQARYGEASLVLDRVAKAESARPADRARARLLRADALFALGADNPASYGTALEAYRAIAFDGALDASGRLAVAFRIGRTLEKLRRYDEAVEQYYAQVVVPYRDGRAKGESFDDDARAAFSRAAFRLADEFESRGREEQAVGVLRLVAASDVPAAEEAARRLERISRKGRFL